MHKIAENKQLIKSVCGSPFHVLVLHTDCNCIANDVYRLYTVMLYALMQLACQYNQSIQLQCCIELFLSYTVTQLYLIPISPCVYTCDVAITADFMKTSGKLVHKPCHRSNDTDAVPS